MQTTVAGVTLTIVLAAAPALAQNVKITPIGSHEGELCANDRATLFEDPTGVRILYDVGHNVTGPDDPRLGDVHVVLLTHVHGDHIGDRKLKEPGAGTCADSGRVPTGPNSMTAEVAAAKKAALVMTSDMGNFVGAKVQKITGGKLRPASRTAALIKQLKGATPHLAISGRTMEFDGGGKCVAGC